MPSISILLMEESPLLQKMIQRVALSQDCFINIAETSAKALQMFKKIPYDLILVDIEFPDTTGYTVTQHMRRHEKKHHRVPTWIIGIASTRDDEKIHLGIYSGMNFIYYKPLSAELLTPLLNMINSLFLNELIVKEGLTAKDEPEQVIDLELGANILNSTCETAGKMIGELVNFLPDDLKNLQAAFSKKDDTALKELAYYIKHRASFCGTPRLKNAAYRLGKIIKTDAQKSDITTAYQHLCEEITKVIQEYHLYIQKK